MNNDSRLNYRGNNFRGTARGYGRQNNRENYRNERYSSNNRDRSRTRERILKYADILWNRTLVLLEDKLSSTTVDFIRSEGKLKTKCLY